LADEVGQLSLDTLTVRFIALHAKNEVVSITDVFDDFIRFGHTGRFMHDCF